MLVEVAADIKAKAPFLNPNILPKNANAVLKTIIFLFSDKCNQKNYQPEKRHKKTALIKSGFLNFKIKFYIYFLFFNLKKISAKIENSPF